MQVLFLILLQVILPVFALIILGIVMQRKLQFDLGTLSKLTTYLLLPAVSFTNIYESNFDQGLLGKIFGFLLLQSFALMILTSTVAKAAGYDRKLTSSFKNSVVLINSGNFGMPVSQLVFAGNPVGASVQVVVFIFQNTLTSTYGLLTSVSSEVKGMKIVRELLKLPTLYAVLLGFLLHWFSVEIPAFLWNPVLNLSDAFLAIALIALGAQSANLQFHRLSWPLAFSVLGRLVIAPCIALGLIFCLGLDGTIAQALLIASSFPSSRNSALFALEYQNYPEYAAQTVLLSTLLSSLTVTVVVYVSKLLFT